MKVKLTPAGMETPEGVARLNAALKAFEDSHATVANLATQFFRQNSDIIKAVIVRSDDEGAVEDYKELVQAMDDRSAAQDAFLRAMSGR